MADPLPALGFDEKAYLDGLAAEVAEEVAVLRREPLRTLWKDILLHRQKWFLWGWIPDYPSYCLTGDHQVWSAGVSARYWYDNDAIPRWNKLKKKYTMFDVKLAQKEAEEEVRADALKAAKNRIKEKLVLIEKAKATVANLEREYEVLLREIGA